MKKEIHREVGRGSAAAAVGLLVLSTSAAASGQVFTATSGQPFAGVSSPAAVVAGSAGSRDEGFRDPRDGRTYPVVDRAGLRWLGRNLAFNAPGSFCYADDPGLCDASGRLYPWEVALRACPGEWRLPGDADWKALERALGMSAEEADATGFRGSDEGARLRKGGTAGFGVRPVGYRRPDGSYARRGERAAYWTSTEDGPEAAWHRDLRPDDDRIYRSSVPKRYALSVRCVRDVPRAEGETRDRPGGRRDHPARAVPAGREAEREAGRRTKRVDAVPVSGGMRLDGRLDEPGWSRARPATGFVQFEPTPGAAPSERTEARVLFDDEGLWVGIRAHDAGQRDVVARLGRRDTEVYSDWVRVAIDSYFDRRTAFVFGVNAAGVRRDVRYANDDAADDSWDAVWDAATAVDDDGWSAEFRIPFHQLRFSEDRSEGPSGGASGDEGGGREPVWGIQFTREIPAKREVLVWSPVREESGAFVSRFGELHGLELDGAPARLEIMPYTVGRLTRAPGSEDDPLFRADDWSGTMGADFKLGLGPALTLTGTLNPDFGQVEADASVVNLTAFETFFPEKRPFFVEGSETLGFLGPSLFYSRRIGRTPQGSPPGEAVSSDIPRAATILGAAKLSGKTGSGWTIGALEAVTAAEDATFVDGSGNRDSAPVEPLTHYTVARAQKDLREGRTTLGAMVTATNRHLADDRLSFLHGAAYVAGIDARHRFGGDRYRVRGSLSGSHVRGTTEAIARTQRSPGHYFQRPDAEHLAFDPERTSLTGTKAFAQLQKIAGGHWRWSLAGVYTAPTYEVNDLGFHFGNDRMWESANLRYVDLAPGGALRSWSAQLSEFGGWTTGGERLDVNFTAQADVELESGFGWGVWAMRHQGGIDRDALRGGPSLVNPGRWMYRVDAFTDRRNPLSVGGGVYWEHEDGTDGRVVDAGLEAEYRPADRLSLSAGPSVRWNRDAWQYITTRTVEGSPHYVLGRLEQTTASLELRADYTFTPDLSFELYAQPFLSAGRYDRLATVADPRAAGFEERFHAYGPDEITTTRDPEGRRVHTVSPSGSGESFSLAPDFNFRQLRSNAVLRWEYRPGSTLFLVWSQDRTARAPDGRFRLGRDLDELLGAPGRNVFLVKVRHWLGL